MTLAEDVDHRFSGSLAAAERYIRAAALRGQVEETPR